MLLDIIKFIGLAVIFAITVEIFDNLVMMPLIASTMDFVVNTISKLKERR